MVRLPVRPAAIVLQAIYVIFVWGRPGGRGPWVFTGYLYVMSSYLFIAFFSKKLIPGEIRRSLLLGEES